MREVAKAILALGLIALMTTAHAERMAESRAKARELVIPPPKDPARRAAAEADDELWLRTYCADVFYNPFSPYHKEIIHDCGQSLQYGTKKCEAAPRGGGKTSIVKYLTLKYSMRRQVRFPLFLGATGEKAKDALDSIKLRLAMGATRDPRTNKFRLRSTLGEDYPLECCTAAYVHQWPSRARNAAANGGRLIHVEWGANCIILPTWEDEEPLGPILLALGITSDELQGCNVYDQRPDFVVLDDLDSRDSLASEDGVVAEKIKETVDKTIAGLGGQSRRLGQFMLCTITSRDSAAYHYSSPLLAPSWSGKRIAALVKWPEQEAKWTEYIELRQAGQNTLDEAGNPVDVFGRKAHQLYLDSREEMDRGAVLSNPYNFDASILPDGSQKQVSALQACYDYIADNGMASFLTECQNDPPEDTGRVESGISKELVRRQVSGFGRRVIPDDCIALAHGCDVGKTKGFHWVVRAFRADGTGFTIDYGNMDVIGTKYASDEGLDRAIYNSVRRREEEFRAAVRGECDEPYRFKDGRLIGPDAFASCYDARYRDTAVMRAVKSLGIGVYAIMGIGNSAGAKVKGKFHPCAKASATRKPGRAERFYFDRGNDEKLWVVHADTDYWKAWEHDRWMTAKDKPGCMFLWGDDDTPAHQHDLYARHIVAEIETEEIHKGVLRRVFVPNSSEMDWLDASYYADVAAAIKGVRIIGAAGPARTPPEQRLSARQLAEQARKAS